MLLVSVAAAQQRNTPEIGKAEIRSVINSSTDCDDVNQIDIDHLEYFDFDADGKREAVVIASTCMTGTAGPDIHAVYTRDAHGVVVEMPFHDSYGDPFFGNRDRKIPVFGNPNYGLTVENGKLVARWMDSSDREAPLVIWYTWNGKEFVVDHIKVEGPFATSYDCHKASSEIDRAICYSPGIAALDLQLGHLYHERVVMLSPDKKKDFQQQQRDWIASRDKQCTIYKWWVECLKDLYSKRISELK